MLKRSTSEIRPEKFICGSDNQPLVVYHGTNQSFKEFDEAFLCSVGFHFGCREQAEFRARLGPRRIIKAHLVKGRALLDIREKQDPGWEQPALTCMILADFGVFSLEEAHALDFPMSTHASATASESERRVYNSRIGKLLRAKGWDSVAYSNDNEPNDGARRDAYAVFSADQIHILGFEDENEFSVKHTHSSK